MHLPHLLPNGHLLDLAVIAASGQAFRMRPLGDMWTIVDGETVIVLQKQNGEVRYATWPEGETERVERLFRCDVSEKEIEKELAVDPYVMEAARAWKGLWLLQQEPWETTVSFIISANKHFLGIQQCCDALARRYGKRLETPWGEFYAFPRPEALARVADADLRDCKVGYRSAFIADAARLLVVEPDFLECMYDMSTQEAVAHLTRIHGIGDKIADCILLFAYGRDDVVPYDVWLRRICTDLYDLPKNSSYEKLRAWHRQHFGSLAGWAQQWLFCHARVVHRRGQSLKATWFAEESTHP